MITDAEAKQKIAKYLMSRVDARFFGKVIIVFQSGKVTHIIEEKSLKLEALNN